MLSLTGHSSEVTRGNEVSKALNMMKLNGILSTRAHRSAAEHYTFLWTFMDSYCVDLKQQHLKWYNFVSENRNRKSPLVLP